MLTTFLLTAVLSTTQTSNADLMKLLPQWLADEGAVGVSVAVVADNHQWQATSGWADRENQKPVQATTVFRLGSVSKQIAGTAAIQLVDQGKLNLDVSVTKYVAGFPEPDGTVTLRQLLSHTSGMRHYQVLKRENLFEFTPTNKALGMFMNDPRVGKPGEKYSYSTHAFTVVVAAVEKASGMSYTDYVRKNISGGSTLDCELLSDSKPARTQLYRKNKEKPVLETKREDNSWKFGGGGLESTASDLAKFGYMVAKAEVVTPKGRDAMWTKQKTSDGKEVNYGLGWGIGADGMIQHSGGQQGCSAYLLIDPKRNISVAVMSNTNGMDVGRLARAILKDWK
ncbi:MAG: beta-lactamase family protein [Fimbriimonadaceae bacterium]|nr:beta-lactamase family protein [Fimbriimonadaceae bacterium]